MSFQSQSKTFKTESMGPQVNPEAPTMSPKSTSGSKKHRKSQKHNTKNILSANTISLTSIDHQSIKSNQIKQSIHPISTISSSVRAQRKRECIQPNGAPMQPAPSHFSALTFQVRVKGPAAWAKPLYIYIYIYICFS